MYSTNPQRYKIGKIFLGVLCVLLCFCSNSFAATKKNTAKDEVNRTYEYSITLKEKFKSDKEINENLNKRLYSLLNYMIETEELLNASGKKFLITEMKDKVDKQGKLQGYKDLDISVQKLSKIKLEVTVKKNNKTDLVRKDGSFETTFDIGVGAAPKNNYDKKVAMNLFELKIPYAAFPKEANIKDGEYSVKFFIRFFE